MTSISLAVHGGAGGSARALRGSDRDGARRVGLVAALVAGHAVLRAGGAALDAVTEAVAVLEDHPSFNAGRGSVLRDDGSVVMDASLMSGADARAGAVAGVRTVRNPVRAARAVLEEGRHVLLAGEGAESFAFAHGLERADLDWLRTGARARQLERLRARDGVELDHDAETPGTVGAVARDAAGHLAAATSTGGMGNAPSCRIGDSPLVGAGTWARDGSCAVSATGDGEIFIRCAFAHEIDARVRLAGDPLARACAEQIAVVRRLGGVGGCVALGPEHDPVFAFITPLMPRGQIDAAGVCRVALVAGEPLRRA